MASILATPLPHQLSAEGRATAAFLRGDAPAGEKADRAYRFIYSVGEHALAFHFTEPAARLGVGGVARLGIDVAVQVALSGLRLPLRAVLSSLNDAQHLVVADEIDSRLRPADAEDATPASPL
jgi:hypothetical protein